MTKPCSHRVAAVQHSCRCRAVANSQSCQRRAADRVYSVSSVATSVQKHATSCDLSACSGRRLSDRVCTCATPHAIMLCTIGLHIWSELLCQPPSQPAAAITPVSLQFVYCHYILLTVRLLTGCLRAKLGAVQTDCLGCSHTLKLRGAKRCERNIHQPW